MIRYAIKRRCFLMVAAVLPLLACNPQAPLFNPAFINTVSGGIVPIAPGERSGFIMVEVVNATPFDIEFRVSVEREGATGIEIETVELETFANAPRLAVLFDCPILRVGLGEDLNQPSTEAGLFIGGTGGFGVPSSVNPLVAAAGNFECGDAIIFLASSSGNNIGGVIVSTAVIRGADQTVTYSGPDTFVVLRDFLEQQVEEQ